MIKIEYRCALPGETGVPEVYSIVGVETEQAGIREIVKPNMGPEIFKH